MAIEHDAIPDAERHEPRGISTATSLEVYSSDGAGSGSWKRSVLSDHAEMAITNNATTTAVTTAVDPTLNTDSDYVKITAGWAETHSLGITFSTDKLIVPVTGHYMINFWAAIKIPLNNNFIGVKYAVNDTIPYSAQKIVTQSVTTTDYRNVFASGIATLTAGDTLSVYVAGSKTDNLVVEEAGLQSWLIHET